MISDFKRLLVFFVLTALLTFLFFPQSAAAKHTIEDLSEDSSMRIEYRYENTSENTLRQGSSERPRQKAPAQTIPKRIPQGPIASPESSLEPKAPVVRSVLRSCAVGDPLVWGDFGSFQGCLVMEPVEEVPVERASGGGVGRSVGGGVPEVVEIKVSASDLVELIPVVPQIGSDFGGFGLKHAHTNFFVTSAGEQTVSRVMFGREVVVTARPVEFRWDFGDGESLVTTVPGGPVDGFNVQTQTSHQFGESGVFTVGLTTVFEGTYQVDGGPVQAVSSQVVQQAEPFEVQIMRAVTRNVATTCAQDPTAWGCEP